MALRLYRLKTRDELLKTPGVKCVDNSFYHIRNSIPIEMFTELQGKLFKWDGVGPKLESRLHGSSWCVEDWMVVPVHNKLSYKEFEWTNKTT